MHDPDDEDTRAFWVELRNPSILGSQSQHCRCERRTEGKSKTAGVRILDTERASCQTIELRLIVRAHPRRKGPKTGEAGEAGGGAEALLPCSDLSRSS